MIGLFLYRLIGAMVVGVCQVLSCFRFAVFDLVGASPGYGEIIPIGRYGGLFSGMLGRLFKWTRTGRL